MNIRNLGEKLPYPIKQSLQYIYGTIPLPVQYGKVFRDKYKFLQESQWWSREKLEEYQMKQLEKLLKRAYENVPYYKRVFDERGLKPEDLKTKDDLIKLPILTKEIIRNNFNDLLDKNIHKKELFSMKTSGSTVSPLSFFWHRSLTIPINNAFLWTAWNIAGYKFNEKRLELTWETLDKGLWNYNPAKRVMKLSSSILSEDVLHTYVKLIRKCEPKVLKSIPSVLVVLAEFMKKNKISIFPSIKTILCDSEQIFPWQKELIEKVFQCRLFTLYGQKEAVVLATECEVNSQYHIFPEYGVTEIIGADELPVVNHEDKGRIIGTGFINYAMPFIRYDIGDIAVWSNKKCTCGRNYPLLQSIEGRENEYLVTSNGDLVPAIIIPYSSIMKNTKQFQFYQDVKGRASIKLVPLPTFTQDDAKRIIDTLRQEVKGIEFKLEYVDIIHRTERGKFKYVIQKLPIKFGSSPN